MAANKTQKGQEKETKMANGTEKNIPIQKTVFDLDSFSEVTLIKYFDFTPVESVNEALAAVGNDSVKFISIINEGLKAERRRIENADLASFRTFAKDEDGEETKEVNGPFNGTIADPKMVNDLVLTLAKTTFGYEKDSTKEEKRTAKDLAMAYVRTAEPIKAGLKARALKKMAQEAKSE